jgi:hypothetical protein
MSADGSARTRCDGGTASRAGRPGRTLLREWSEPSAFGADWLRRWAPYAKRQIVGIARVLRRYP